MHRIELFESSRGEKPVATFMDDLDDATLHKVLRVIDLLERYGVDIMLPYSKRINKSIAELRTTGKNPVRILYGYKNSTFVLLHAFKKKTNKLPDKEIKLAEKRFDSL